jgi:hypothetical protein
MKLFNRNPKAAPANRFESISEDEIVKLAYTALRDAWHRETEANEKFKKENGRDNIIALARIEQLQKQLTELRWAIQDL